MGSWSARRHRLKGGPGHRAPGYRRLTAVLTLCLSLVATMTAAQCARDAVTLRGDWGQARFSVEVADTAATRARGLMYVEEMPALSGMLFVYPDPRPVSFWMRNTLIPLDMLFFDATGRLTRLHPMARPRDETAIPGGQAVQFVLEINGGMAARLGIAEGDVMRHPAIGSDAAWPCPAD